MNTVFESHHLVLIALVVGVALWRGWIPIPAFNRRREAPAPVVSQPEPVFVQSAAPATAPRRRKIDPYSVIDASPPEVLGEAFVQKVRAQAQKELDQEHVAKATESIKTQYKAPFVPAAPAPSPPAAS